MAKKTVKTKEKMSTPLAFAGELTIQHVAAFRDEFVRALEASDNILVDLSAASEVDLSFFQLLCSSHRTAVEMNKSLCLAGWPKNLLQTLEDAGFDRHVGCVLDCQGSCIWASLD